MKIAVLLSGGVDSSVALNILKEEGHDLTAFYLKIWLEDDAAFLGDCPWDDDLKYAREVCEKIDVPLKIVNLQAEYLNIVVEYALAELRAGRTPSPDIWCNKQIKFGEFFKHIDSDYDKIASGHYAQIEEKDGYFYLKQGVDPVKDQTYFLTYLSQEQLSKILFPIGHLHKKDVRELAEKYDLPNKARKDSQGICFLGKIKYSDFVKYHLGVQKGDLIEFETGKVMGLHNGFWFHTIGQRQGLGLSGGPWYVIKKDTLNNIVYISRKEVEQDVAQKEFTIANVNWIPFKPQMNEYRIKIRHGAATMQARIEELQDNRLKIILENEEFGIAAGQYTILYDSENYCWGGGVIE